jgi:hypothetical protein
MRDEKENNKKSWVPRQVAQYMDSGVFIKKFDSIETASAETGIHRKYISYALRSGTTAGGFKWKFIE